MPGTRITLRMSEAMQFPGAPALLALPRLLARRMHHDEGNAVATSNWDGDVYSYGAEEDENPTSIDAVREALTTAVADRLAASF